MKSKLLMIAVLIFISGCARTIKTYKHPNPNANYTKDHYECLIKADEIALQGVARGFIAARRIKKRTYHNCMSARGWIMVAEKKIYSREEKKWIVVKRYILKEGSWVVEKP